MGLANALSLGYSCLKRGYTLSFCDTLHKSSYDQYEFILLIAGILKDSHFSADFFEKFQACKNCKTSTMNNHIPFTQNQLLTFVLCLSPFLSFSLPFFLSFLFFLNPFCDIFLNFKSFYWRVLFVCFFLKILIVKNCFVFLPLLEGGIASYLCYMVVRSSISYCFFKVSFCSLNSLSSFWVYFFSICFDLPHVGVFPQITGLLTAALWNLIGHSVFICRYVSWSFSIALAVVSHPAHWQTQSNISIWMLSLWDHSMYPNKNPFFLTCLRVYVLGMEGVEDA